MHAIHIPSQHTSDEFPLKKKWGFGMLGPGGRLIVFAFLALLAALLLLDVFAFYFHSLTSEL
jgi:hypothetical protein